MVINEPIRLTEDEADFAEALIDKNKRIINNLMRVSLGSEFSHLYEDCVSEVYLAVCQNAKELKNHPSPDGWVIVATKNIAKKQKNKEIIRIKRTNMQTDISPDGDNVFEDVLYKIMREDETVEKIIDTFTPREKEIYKMVYRQGMGLAEIAEALGIAPSTVRNIHKNLKDKVYQYIEDNLR